MPSLQGNRLDRGHGSRHGPSELVEVCKLRPREIRGIRVRRRHRPLRHVEIQHPRPAIVLSERYAVSGAVLMKVSYNWLREFVDISETPQQLGARLTNAGLAVDALDSQSD